MNDHSDARDAKLEMFYDEDACRWTIRRVDADWIVCEFAGYSQEDGELARFFVDAYNAKYRSPEVSIHYAAAAVG